jgi:multidrug resistance efflux pump
MGLFMRRRRPVMRVAAGAATAGVAYKAGKRHAEGEATEAQQPAAAPAPAPAADSTAELERLAQLHQSGALSDEEFAAAKAKVLGS